MINAKKRRTGQFSATAILATPSSKARKVPMRSRRKSISRKRTLRTRRRARNAIKNVVEKVMACKDNVGIYTKSYGGDIRCDVAQGTKTVVVHAQRVQGNAAPYTEFGMGFFPYNLKRILDAASVLYKNKTKSIEGPGVLGAPNFDFKGLKVDVLYASYHLALTNMTSVKYYVEIIEFTNKFNSNTACMEVIEELLKGTNWSQGVPSFVNAGNGIWRLEDCLDFGMIKGISSRYAIKSFGRKLVTPGGTINYFTKDKMCIDFQKKLYTESTGTDPEIPSFAKGEKQVVVVLKPVTGIISNATNFTYGGFTVGNDANHGFVTKVQEVFKLIEPDATADEFQGDKRVFLCDENGPATGTLTRIDRDYGPTLSGYIGVV